MFLGDVVHSRGSAIDAKALYERAIAVKERQVTENATSWEHRYVLACLLRRRGLMLRDLGDPAGAAADVRRAVQLCEALPPRSHWDLIETACCHAALAGLAGRTASGVSAAQAEAEVGASDRMAAPCGRHGIPQCQRTADRVGSRPAPRPR